MKNFGFSLFALVVSLAWPAEAHATYPLECKPTMGDGRVYYMSDPAKASKCKYSIEDPSSCTLKTSNLNCQWSGSYFPNKESGTATSSKTTTATNTNTGTSGGIGGGGFTLNFNFGAGNGSSTRTNTATASNSNTRTTTATASNTKTNTASSTKTNTASSTKTNTASTTQTSTEASIATATQTDSSTEISTVPETADGTKVKNKDDLEEAIKEAKLSAGKVEEMKLTMEEIKVSNQNNAILYRSPDGNVGSVDPRFNAFSAGLSGDIGSSGAGGGGLLGNGLKNLLGGKRGAKDKSGRALASNGNGEIDIANKGDKSGSSTNADGTSATSDNPWVSYMGQTSKAGLIDRLRKNPGLRDSLRDRIGELQAKGDQTGVIALMEEALAAAELESQEPNLDDLKPMSISEAFSMDAAETAAQIRSLLADLDSPSDRQFLPQESLFERVSVAHRRSLVRGAVKTTR